MAKSQGTVVIDKFSSIINNQTGDHIWVKGLIFTSK